MAPTSNTRYHMLPRNSIDSDDDAGADEALLRSPLSVNTAVTAPRKAFSITLNPYVVLRIFSGVLTLISFILFVIVGSASFIAAAFFSLLCSLHNLFMLIHYAGGNRLSFSVEYQNKLWNLGRPAKSCTPSLGKYIDLLHAAFLMIALTIGTERRHVTGSRDGWWSNPINDMEIAGVVLGYFALVLQVFVAVPRLDRLFCTFKVAVKPKKQADSDLPEHPVRGPDMLQANTSVQGPVGHRPDVKQPSLFDTDEPERTSIPEAEQPAPVTGNASDLV